VQHVLTAAAMHLARVARWLMNRGHVRAARHCGGYNMRPKWTDRGIRHQYQKWP
jgi:hypothetical protein